MSRAESWRKVQALMPALQSQTYVRLRRVIQDWMADDFQLEPLLKETDAIWAHVSEFLEDQDSEVRSPEAVAAHAGIRRALLLHAQACQQLEEALRKDDLEASPGILQLLAKGDQLLGEVQTQIRLDSSIDPFL